MPEVKAKQKSRKMTPEYKAYQKEYNKKYTKHLNERHR